MTDSQLKKRRIVSEVIAVIGIILLTTDTINTFTSQEGLGFLNLTDRQSGISLCIPSIIFLLTSFGIGYRLKTKLVTLLLMYGGMLLAISKIIEPSFDLNLFLALALPNVYILLIILGFVIFGLGLWRTFKKL